MTTYKACPICGSSPSALKPSAQKWEEFRLDVVNEVLAPMIRELDALYLHPFFAGRSVDEVSATIGVIKMLQTNIAWMHYV